VGELAPQRQQATVMWVRIPEQHAIFANTQADTALRALSHYFDAVQRAVQRSGGMVDRFQGTSVLAYFGAPLPLRNPQRAALEAALTITRSHAVWGASVADAHGALPQLVIGIAAGPVVSGQVPMTKSNPFVLVGEAVDQAMHLATTAAGVATSAGFKVLVSAQVAESVGHAGLEVLPHSTGTGPPTYTLIAR
jgi:adenylate cyclase